MLCVPTFLRMSLGNGKDGACCMSLGNTTSSRLEHNHGERSRRIAVYRTSRAAVVTRIPRIPERHPPVSSSVNHIHIDMERTGVLCVSQSLEDEKNALRDASMISDSFSCFYPL